MTDIVEGLTQDTGVTEEVTTTEESTNGLSNLLSGDVTEEQETTTEVSEDVEQEEEGERPEWLPEKFKTPEAMAEAYKNLEGKFGSLSGAPETYELNTPEGIEFYEDVDHGIEAFQSLAKEMGIDQEGFDKVIEFYSNAEIQRAQLEMQATESSVYEAFGGEKEAQKAIPKISARVKGLLGDDISVYQDAASNTPTSAASAIKLAGMLIEKLGGNEFNQQPSASVPSTVSHSEVKEMQRDPRYGKDREFTAKVTKLYQDLFDKK